MSISGFRASARTPPYGAVKAAILEYTQTTAGQFARKGIRVNCIAPGSIEFPGGTWERAKNSNPNLWTPTGGAASAPCGTHSEDPALIARRKPSSLSRSPKSRRKARAGTDER